ncbi:glycoside hydrolase family 17 protein [Serendipita vermifera MAFF 305830]|uniref:glucan endo-1,3-beta-D-glucosidase n=1 Tax=Serendipita vermifera MAFF 305830 TaxID=933852 RepID=A0A0C2WF24_SERVB|nr:glycoside hydrolase family 17 protein [Serendipita vermifera MAFF 305830]
MKPVTKKIVWGVAIVAALGVVGAVIGVVVVEVNKNRASNASSDGSSSNSTSSSSSTNGLNAPTATGTSSAPVPTGFTPNPALHKSFYGMAYTPGGAIMPQCGANIANVTKDIQILSQLTTRLRLYGSDCNVTSLVLQAIQDTQVDIKVFAAIYLEPEELSYTRQKTILENALATYGTTNVLGIAVGNEYVLQAIQAGDTSENATTRVVTKMTEVRTDLIALGYNLPVGTSDAGGTVTQEMVNGADFVFDNIHPWFSSNTAETAVTFANSFFTSSAQPLAAASTRTTTMYQGEFGWPSGSDTVGDVNQAGSAASVANLQLVLDNWVCSANTAGTPYFWFSAFDEPWKATTGLGVEAHWGLMDAEYNLKDITLPTCLST